MTVEELEKVITSQKELLAEYERENAELKQKYDELNDFEKSQCAKLLKENAELKAQIEKMKCCWNCKHRMNTVEDNEVCWNCERSCARYGEEIIKDNWEKAE